MPIFLTLQKHYKLFLFSIFFLVWGVSSWHPENRQNWFAENTILFMLLPVTVGLSMKYTQLSKLSYTFITIFLVMHVVGSHYGYASVPFGSTLGEFLWVGGNIYDKFVHFSFGLLMFHPLREVLSRVTPSVTGFWSYFFSYIAILGLSAAYEIFEWITVLHVDPQIGYLFIGGTDPFDSTKDMFMAGVGACAALLIIGIHKRFFIKTQASEV